MDLMIESFPRLVKRYKTDNRINFTIIIFWYFCWCFLRNLKNKQKQNFLLYILLLFLYF